MTMQEHKMDLTGPYLVHSANIVIVAKEHDPMIINPSVLVAKNIVPADLEVVESSLSFFESKVQYEEMIWTINSSRLEIAESCDGSFKEDYLIYNLANKYLSEFPYIPYKNFGMNYNLAIRKDDPISWINKKFLPPTLKSDNRFSILPEILYNMDNDIRCKISLDTGNIIPPDGKQEKSIIVRINIDHQNTSLEKIQKGLSAWKEKQILVMSLLDKLFGVDV